jgi:hypothetical protein
MHFGLYLFNTCDGGTWIWSVSMLLPYKKSALNFVVKSLWILLPFTKMIINIELGKYHYGCSCDRKRLFEIL